MKMKQREILNQLNLDFRRENQTQQEYLEQKMQQIKTASREYLQKSGLEGYILGLSGGIDSFTCAALLCDALKDMGVVRLILQPNGVQVDLNDSKECAQALQDQFHNLEIEEISIENGYAGVVRDLAHSSFFAQDDLYTLGNVQPRLRMVEQYALGKRMLVAGTDHATENIVGYFTKYGDGGVDFCPLDGLLKRDIYEIARHYHAPECVLTKAPAAGLGISESDEAEMHMTYAEIQSYLTGNLIEKEQMQRMVSMFETSQHKRNLPASPMNLWWKQKKEPVTHVIIDATHAFIDMEMACHHGKEAVQEIVNHCNCHAEERVLYVRDLHPADHCSFQEQGGLWPAHAVEGTKSAAFPSEFYALAKAINTPIERYNVFEKGRNSLKEEYSGFNAMNAQYGALKFNLTKSVLLSGIATEYCVKETAMDLLKNGFHVALLVQGLGYVEEEAHQKALAEMKEAGIELR